jgi:acetoin utilization protein AcuB
MANEYEGFIKEKMTKSPATIGPDSSFYEARAIIRDKGIRHLPVVDKHGNLVGIVTDRDIRQAGPSEATSLSVNELHYLLSKLKVSSFMTPREKLVTMNVDTLVEEAVQLMRNHKIGCLPVLEGTKLIGLLTETDVLDLFIAIHGLQAKGTRLTLALEDKPGQLHDVLEVMKNRKVNVTSVIIPGVDVKGKKITAIRIQTDEYEPIVQGLKEKGFEVLSVNRWKVSQ